MAYSASDPTGHRDMGRGVTIESCPVCDGEPRVLLVMRHPTMLRLTRELLSREFGCWIATEVHTGGALAGAIDRDHPDLMVIDAGDFPRCCRAALNRIAPDRVIVVGPEPDPSYQAIALSNGAGSWLPRERLGEELAIEMRRILGCVHDPCPPGYQLHRTPAHSASTATPA